jgi:hypothetical protein
VGGRYRPSKLGNYKDEVGANQGWQLQENGIRHRDIVSYFAKASKGQAYFTSIILLAMTIRHIKIIVSKGRQDKWIPASAGMTAIEE